MNHNSPVMNKGFIMHEVSISNIIMIYFRNKSES